MTKIDIISGFLGAGKTTLIKKLIAALRESRNEEFKEFATGMVEKLKAA